MLQKRVADVISTVRTDCGDISLRELCRRSALPPSTMSRAQNGDAEVSVIEILVSLAKVWPRGDIRTLLIAILPEEEAAQLSVGAAKEALSAETQAALDKASSATAVLNSLIHQGDLKALIRLAEALGPAVEAVRAAADAVGLEAMAIRNGEADLAAVLGTAEGHSERPGVSESENVRAHVGLEGGES